MKAALSSHVPFPTLPPYPFPFSSSFIPSSCPLLFTSLLLFFLLYFSSFSPSCPPPPSLPLSLPSPHFLLLQLLFCLSLFFPSSSSPRNYLATDDCSEDGPVPFAPPSPLVFECLPFPLLSSTDKTDSSWPLAHRCWYWWFPSWPPVRTATDSELFSSKSWSLSCWPVPQCLYGVSFWACSWNSFMLQMTHRESDSTVARPLFPKCQAVIFELLLPLLVGVGHWGQVSLLELPVGCGAACHYAPGFPIFHGSCLNTPHFFPKPPSRVTAYIYTYCALCN